MEARASEKATRDWLRFDRVDYVGTKVILGIAILVSVLLAIGVPIVQALTHAPLPVSLTTKVTDVDLPRGATHDGFATMDLLLTDPTVGERLAQTVPALVFAVSSGAVAWMLSQLLRSTEAGEPFTQQNVKRINVIALIIGLGGVLVQVAQAFADNAIHTSGRLPDSGARTLVFEMTFTPLPLVVMLVIALVGEVFRRGVKLRNDVEGLV